MSAVLRLVSTTSTAPSPLKSASAMLVANFGAGAPVRNVTVG